MVNYKLYPVRLKSIDHSIIMPILVVSINPKFSNLTFTGSGLLFSQYSNYYYYYLSGY